MLGSVLDLCGKGRSDAVARTTATGGTDLKKGVPAYRHLAKKRGLVRLENGSLSRSIT
jgi:hypothetical protein